MRFTCRPSEHLGKENNPHSNVPTPHELKNHHILANPQNPCFLDCLQDILQRFLQNQQKPSHFLSQHEISPSLRNKMLDWMIEVMNTYNCSDATFHRSVQVMDSYLCSQSNPQNQGKLHLIGVGSMFLSSKYEEIYPIKLKTVHEKIAHRKLSLQQIRNAEARILSVLNFDMTKPTVIDFSMIVFLLTRPKDSQYLTETVLLLSKLLLFEYQLLCSYRPSLLAAGLIHLSLQIISQTQCINIQAETIKLLEVKSWQIQRVSQMLLQRLRQFKEVHPQLKNINLLFQSSIEEGIRRIVLI